jgi:hypothetical protein
MGATVAMMVKLCLPDSQELLDSYKAKDVYN